MKKFKLLSLTLALLIVLTSFAGCGSDDSKKDSQTNKAETNSPVASDENSSADKDTTDSTIKVEYGVNKIGSIDRYISSGNSGVYYRGDNQKYGIMSLDGKKDTGSKYVTCEPIGDYFEVTLKRDYNANDISSLNVTGVVDVNGNIIIPMEYATVDKINDRYVKATKITNQTEDKNNYLLRLSSSLFSVVEKEGDVFFEGVWYIYDLTTGKKINGIEGTKSYTPSVCENVITFRSDDNKLIKVNDKGEKLPDDAKLFRNGYYTINDYDSGTGALYDSYGKKLLDYSTKDFHPTDSDNDKYLTAIKQDDSGKTKYALMDYTGKVVSAEFDNTFVVYGDFIFCNEKLYNLDGTTVVNDTVKYVYPERSYGNAYVLKNDKTHILVKSDGTVLYKGEESDTITFDTYSTLGIKKKVDNKTMYYSFADKDFTLEGSALVSWLIKVKNENDYDLVDSLTGETLIRGYDSYSYVEVDGPCFYIYALKDGKVDIYTIK